MTIPDEIVNHPQLTPKCVVFYLKLKSLANEKGLVKKSFKQLNINRGVGIKFGWLLEKFGFIEIIHDTIGRGHTNVFRIIK